MFTYPREFLPWGLVVVCFLIHMLTNWITICFSILWKWVPKWTMPCKSLVAICFFLINPLLHGAKLKLTRRWWKVEIYFSFFSICASYKLSGIIGSLLNCFIVLGTSIQILGWLVRVFKFSSCVYYKKQHVD